MWPLEHLWPTRWLGGSVQEVVGIGRAEMERWQRTRTSCTRVANIAFSAEAHTVSGLVGPLTRILDGAGLRSRATLVLESAWLPLVLVDTGGQLLKPRALEALVRHRFGLVHAEEGSAAHWHIRVDHRPGDRYALGYGMGPVLADLLMAGSPARPWGAVLPAFAWGRARWAAHQRRRDPSGWWAWTEQDRTVLSYWDKGRLCALHPALPRTSDQAALMRLAAIEARRWGFPPPQAIEVSDWHTVLRAGTGGRPMPESGRGSMDPAAPTAP